MTQITPRNKTRKMMNEKVTPKCMCWEMPKTCEGKRRREQERCVGVFCPVCAVSKRREMMKRGRDRGDGREQGGVGVNGFFMFPLTYRREKIGRRRGR